jgi:hypothetical protein
MKTKKLNIQNVFKSKELNKLFKSLLMVLTITTLINCTPDDGVYEPFEPQIDGEALAQRFIDNRTNAVQEFTIDAATGGVITGTQGTQVTFQPNSFKLNGNLVTGSVEIQLIEVYDKSSMVLLDKSTLGLRGNGDKEALKSAGEFFVNAQQGGQNLDLAEMAQVMSKPINPAEMDPAMKIFRGGPDQDCDGIDDDCDWVEADFDGNGEQDDPQIRDAQGAAGAMVSYSYDIGDFGWTNLDRWYSFAGAKTEIFIDVPEGFDGDNCAVYLSYDGESNALASMDVWSETEEMFTEHYGLIPVGLEVHIIMVAEIDGQLHYAIQGTTIVDNHVEVISSLSPTTQATLESLINGLP